MEFIETPVFTKLITELLTDDDYRLLQDDIAKNPQAGDLIPKVGGIRKLRFALQAWRGSADLLLADIEAQDIHAAGIHQGQERKSGTGADSIAQGAGKGVGTQWIRNYLTNYIRACKMR